MGLAMIDSLFRALADPTRRALLERLMERGETTVHALTDGAGVSQPAVSKHLATLKAAGLVADRRAGRETHYRAEARALAPLMDWMAHYRGFWSDRLDRLQDTLRRMD
jgi:DNA-binding transcriptional ArsR family regulator